MMGLKDRMGKDALSKLGAKLAARGVRGLIGLAKYIKVEACDRALDGSWEQKDLTEYGTI